MPMHKRLAPTVWLLEAHNVGQILVHREVKFRFPLLSLQGSG